VFIMTHEPTATLRAPRSPRPTADSTRSRSPRSQGAIDEDQGEDDPASDIVWGVKNISKELNRTEAQVRQMMRRGTLEGIVHKLGHKTPIASRRFLRNLAFAMSKQMS
jgi:hypothetical protein